VSQQTVDFGGEMCDLSFAFLLSGTATWSGFCQLELR
jgi:hypothetical protein